MIICWKGGVVSRKSKFIFYAKFWLQKIHSKAKKTVTSLLKDDKVLISRLWLLGCRIFFTFISSYRSSNIWISCIYNFNFVNVCKLLTLNDICKIQMKVIKFTSGSCVSTSQSNNLERDSIKHSLVWSDYVRRTKIYLFI